MTNFTRFTAVFSLSLALTAGSDAAPINHTQNFNLHNFAYKGNSNKLNKGFRSNIAGSLTRGEAEEGSFNNTAVNNPTPEMSFPASEIVGDLDAPDGSLWFYTGNFKYDYVEVNETYKRPVMQEYEFKIYDADMKFVGSIRDKVRYKEGEVAVPRAELAPLVTRNFFNSDDKYEVIVGMYVNTEWYVNNEYSIVYSIGGEKADGYDVALLTRNDMIGDVLNASSNGEENIYISFMKDDDTEVPEKDLDHPDPLDPDPTGYWAQLTSYGLRIETYAKADASGDLVKVWEKRIRLADLPGDQMSSPFFLSFVNEGKPYFLFSKYEDTFFNPYYSYTDETTMRKDNHLVVELYAIDKDACSLIQTTKIPMKLNNEVDDRVLCSYYSVGSFRYRDDAVFANGSQNPDYVVTVQDYKKENDEQYNNSFYRYNPDGSLKFKIFENALSHSTMADLPGFDPCEVFISTNQMGDYVFHVVNLLTAEEELKFTNKFEIDEDIDPELITSNMDRVAFGDSFKYAIELRSPGQDENGNDLMRIMWIDRNGKFERIDEVPMGSGVYYATVLIESKSLNPKLYDADDEYEYLVLVKRGYANNQVKEELLVAKPISEAYPEGKVILYLKPEEERGILKNIAPYTYSENPLLIISYYNEDTAMIYEDFYKLPFKSSDTAVDLLPSDCIDGSSILFDGDCLRADGIISLYNIQGAKVAESVDMLDVTTLPDGVYVARANGFTLKILVK